VNRKVLDDYQYNVSIYWLLLSSATPSPGSVIGYRSGSTMLVCLPLLLQNLQLGVSDV